MSYSPVSEVLSLLRADPAIAAEFKLALIPAQMSFPRADFQAICRTAEPDHSVPFLLGAGPYEVA